jgi:cytochrome c553
MNRYIVTTIAFAAAACVAGPALAQDAAKLEYNRDIRPILAENCFACHGPDSAARKADLRLDKRDVAVEMGAIAPSKPAESVLIERISATDADTVMPPPTTKKKLTAAQKVKLERWIAEGAEYQPHWSLIPPARPEPPAVKNAAWVKNPIDSFILARLERAGLSPAPEADRRTIARRLSLDLTGLPPEPKLVEEFVADQSDNAYEKYVDRLMALPQWGEHRGRHWLDVARYADTHGIHFDNYREIWAYRDWVIGALNRNLPFDQFTTEQLAGDLLPNPTLDQKIATGFCRCNITTNEGGIIDEEYKVLYARDRTDTFAQIWLGTTAGCAVCHDHKFDSITQKDFYSLTAFFDNTTQPVRDGNIKDPPPILTVPLAGDRPRFEAIQGELAGVRGQIDTRKKDAQPDFDAWLAKFQPEELAQYVPTEGLVMRAPLDERKGNSLHVSIGGQDREVSREKDYTFAAGRNGADGKARRRAFSLATDPPVEIADAGDFEADQGFSVSVWLSLGRRGQTGAILARMDNTQAHRGWDLWLEGDKVGMHIIDAWPDNALKVVCQTPLEVRKFTHVTVTYDGSKKAGGLKIYYNGQPQPVTIAADKLSGSTKTAVPLKLGQRHTSERLSQMLLQDLRLYSRGLAPQEAEQLARIDQLEDVLAKPATERTDEDKTKVFEWYLATLDGPSKELDAKLKGLAQEEVQIKARGTIAHVMNERTEAAAAFILYRGEYDKRRDPVKAATPGVFPPMAEGLPHNRLGLAQWLLAADHPMTARVTVNRFWQELFGTGLVKTAGDFGVAGELPSHPELLDWLAVEFRSPQDGSAPWDMKRFFKLLVMSNTYRQAAATTPEKLAKDADNRLLSRGPRYRMDGEMVRDYALAASGILVPKIGGPSVKPYQPDGVWEAVAMIGSNTRDYKRDSGEALYRRSMYTFWKRSAPPASMEIFNAPNRETCVVRRERTNTPLQALVTLNDEQFVEAARHLAQRTLQASGERQLPDGAATDERLDFIAKRLLARPFRAEEVPIVKQSLADLLTHYQAHVDDAKQLIAVGESKADPALDPAQLAAWTMLVNELLNLDEVLNK